MEGYLVDLGPSAGLERGRGSSSPDNPNQNDGVTDFLRTVRQLTLDALPDAIRPNRVSRWAGAHPGLDWAGVRGRFRYYHFWYSYRPWSNHYLSYRVHLSDEGAEAGQWSAYVRLVNFEIEKDLGEMEIHPDQFFEWEGKCSLFLWGRIR